MKINTDSEKIEEILTRGVVEVIDKEHLKKKLLEGKQLRVKFGIDPTSSDLHLGHSVALSKLRQFQDLGHQAVLLIGDFTATIGDPSGRAEARRPLAQEAVKKNMQDYTVQASKILDMKKAEIRYNSEWYKKKKADFFMDMASRFTIARLIERDDFKKRIAEDIDVSINEIFYPLLQGYDSVMLKADLEIGGNDQKFNLLMGRKVQKKYNQPQQDILTTPLLIGTDGIKKMSKSVGNYIGLKESASQMYGKIMSIPDAILWHYFQLLTDMSLAEIEEMKKNVLSATLNKRDAKARLAKEIVSLYHGEKESSKAEQEFNRVFKEKGLPLEITEVSILGEKIDILELLVKTKLVSSKAEARRLITQGGVAIDDEVQKDWKKIVKIKKGAIIRVGRRKFIKIG